jgi:hypothetical protein
MVSSLDKEFDVALQTEEDSKRYILKYCHARMSLWDVLEQAETQ